MLPEMFGRLPVDGCPRRALVWIDAEALRRHTVAVYRRLQPRVFRFLRRAARAVRAARALARAPHERT